jgi:uncharacterized membrane protein YedE/YeeE
VPLSEREQKILQEIERDLHREDPAFVRDVRRKGPGLGHISQARLGGALFVAGFLALLVFFAKQWLLFGVIAFGAMVAGVVLVAGSLRALALRPDERTQPRERLVLALKRWEERLRQRYKGN